MMARVIIIGISDTALHREVARRIHTAATDTRTVIVFQRERTTATAPPVPPVFKPAPILDPGIMIPSKQKQVRPWEDRFTRMFKRR